MMKKEQSTLKTVRRPKVAVCLSLLVPGLGQIYAGDWRRGLALMFGLSVQGVLFYGLALPALVGWLVAVWLWNAIDAYLIASGQRASVAIPILIILVLNLVAACNKTQIKIPQLDLQQRSVIHQIVVGLANPDFVARETAEQTAVGKYLVTGNGSTESLAPVKRVHGQPYLEVTPSIVTGEGKIKVAGRGFSPNATGSLTVLGADETEIAEIKTSGLGAFTRTFKNPRLIPGDYFVQATVLRETGKWKIGETLNITAPRLFETIYLALLGTVFSLLFALPLSFLGARNLMSGPVLKVVYTATRSLFTVLRSVEVLIIAVIAVAAVGIGPFAGVIALAVHGVGALGKLYSEAIESIDHGPIEAIRATGASDFQVIVFAVIPQVVPQFIAFTLYRWDINVRMATVIGLVGGGGIGALLVDYMKLLQWREAATAIWLIAAVVMLMDYASAVIREKVM